MIAEYNQTFITVKAPECKFAHDGIKIKGHSNWQEMTWAYSSNLQTDYKSKTFLWLKVPAIIHFPR